MKKTSQRAQRVADQIQRELADLLANEVKDPRVGRVTITRGAKIRLLRDGAIVHEGEIDTLKRFKDDVREVATGFECGLSLENYNDVKEGDTIESYIIEEVERDLSAEFASKA